MEVKSIKAANIRKTHEKLKAQIENQKDVDGKKAGISINSAKRIFGELMQSSIKKSLSAEHSVIRSGPAAHGRGIFQDIGYMSDINPRTNRYKGPREMDEMMMSMNETPDIRLNKMDDILKKIREGTYRADYLIIADKLLSHDVEKRI